MAAVAPVHDAIIPALAFATLATWQGWPSCLAAAATALSAIGRFQTNEILFRALLLATTPLWAVHDVIVDSLPRPRGRYAQFGNGRGDVVEAAVALRPFPACCDAGNQASDGGESRRLNRFICNHFLVA